MFIQEIHIKVFRGILSAILLSIQKKNQEHCVHVCVCVYLERAW